MSKLPILLLLIGAFGAGFVLVYSLYKPATPADADVTSNIFARVAKEEELPVSASADGGTGAPSPPEPQPLRQRPKTVPPGPIPKGVVVAGSPSYLKCWTKNGDVFPSPKCDKLQILEKRLVGRLYVIERCKNKYLTENAEGNLSLGAKVDFEQKTISFWSGPSSELERAREISTCIRNDLAGLPLDGIPHKMQKYSVYFNLVFRNSIQIEKELLRKKNRGRSVDVVMDHVRVRLAPEEGIIIGKISSGNQVSLLKKRDDWCHVITPNNNEGWMICSALDL